jgi:hypothetical protein
MNHTPPSRNRSMGLEAAGRIRGRRVEVKFDFRDDFQPDEGQGACPRAQGMDAAYRTLCPTTTK